MIGVLITGGCGFIGSNLANRLYDEGYEVAVIDDLSLGILDNLRNKEMHIGESIYRCRDYILDVIFHFGMPSSSPMYRKTPYLFKETVGEFLAILEYARALNAKVIYASTSSIYNGNPLPWSEDMPIRVSDLYTESRYVMERLAELYYGMYDVESVGLRFFSVYGPNEWHKGKYANVITQMIRHGRFTIYGDGSQTRDFIHVDDVVEACIKAMDVRDCTVVNVGTGIETSFNEVAEMIREHIPLEIHYKENPVKNYVERTCADTRNMRRLLKFTPKVDLRTGIERQVEMYGSEKR